MRALVEFIAKHAERGACQCGKCIDAVDHPENHQPTGHTADLVFFKVAAKDSPDAEQLKTLIRVNFKGEFCDLNPLDGSEHSYIEIGGWIGSQDYGLMLMGLGTVLGLWKLLTPRTVLGAEGLDRATELALAGKGYVTVKAEA